MSYLADNINNRFGTESANALIRAFRALELPVPKEENEYKRTADNGALIFLNQDACVIRITPQAYKAYNHPHILQPIAIFPDEKIRIELNRGVTCPTSEQHLEQVSNILKEDNLKINYSDFHKFNVGLLPLKTKDFPDGIPVIIEMPAITVLTENIQPVARMLGNQPFDQDAFNKPLRTAFKQAQQNNNMGSFWQTCRNMKKQGTLIAGWQAKPQDRYHKDVLLPCQEAAKRYHKLRQG